MAVIHQEQLEAPDVLVNQFANVPASDRCCRRTSGHCCWLPYRCLVRSHWGPQRMHGVPGIAATYLQVFWANRYSAAIAAYINLYKSRQ